MIRFASLPPFQPFVRIYASFVGFASESTHLICDGTSSPENSVSVIVGRIASSTTKYGASISFPSAVSKSKRTLISSSMPLLFVTSNEIPALPVISLFSSVPSAIFNVTVTPFIVQGIVINLPSSLTMGVSRCELIPKKP